MIPYSFKNDNSIRKCFWVDTKSVYFESWTYNTDWQNMGPKTQNVNEVTVEEKKLY